MQLLRGVQAATARRTGSYCEAYRQLLISVQGSYCEAYRRLLRGVQAATARRTGSYCEAYRRSCSSSSPKEVSPNLSLCCVITPKMCPNCSCVTRRSFAASSRDSANALAASARRGSLEHVRTSSDSP